MSPDAFRDLESGPKLRNGYEASFQIPCLEVQNFKVVIHVKCTHRACFETVSPAVRCQTKRCGGTSSPFEIPPEEQGCNTTSHPGEHLQRRPEMGFYFSVTKSCRQSHDPQSLGRPTSPGLNMGGSNPVRRRRTPCGNDA